MENNFENQNNVRKEGVGSLENVESKLKEVEQLYEKVGGEEGIKNAVDKMTPEQRKTISNRMMEAIRDVKGLGVLALVAALTVFLTNLNMQEVADRSTELYNNTEFASDLLRYGAASVGAGSFIVMVKKGFSALADRIKLIKAD